MTRPNPIAPAKGDFARGHRAIVYVGGRWLPGDVVDATPARVVLRLPSVAVVLGLGTRRAFTWRRSVGRYVDAADKRAAKGACLALDSRPADEIEPLH